MERSKAGTNKRNPDGLSHPNQNTIFYKKWKKYNKIQLTKNKMELNIRKMTNHSPSPVKFGLTINIFDICKYSAMETSKSVRNYHCV